MNLHEKLAKNAWQSAEKPHIVPADSPDRESLTLLVRACPAGLYRQKEDGSLHIDTTGCLECGTCRLLCDEQTLSRWRYPPAGCGIQLRFG